MLCEQKIGGLPCRVRSQLGRRETASPTGHPTQPTSALVLPTSSPCGWDSSSLPFCAWGLLPIWPIYPKDLPLSAVSFPWPSGSPFLWPGVGGQTPFMLCGGPLPGDGGTGERFRPSLSSAGRELAVFRACIAPQHFLATEHRCGFRLTWVCVLALRCTASRVNFHTAARPCELLFLTSQVGAVIASPSQAVARAEQGGSRC